MESLSQVALVLWLPVSLALFAAMDVRRAILASFLLGFLFLPVDQIKLRGLPEYTKVSATSLGVLLGMLLLGSRGRQRFRFTVWDLPVLVLWLSAGISSQVHERGNFDTASVLLDHFLEWVVPYFAGRLYFQRDQDHKRLAVAMFLGGLLYAPLCLYEIRMSPQLHNMLWGFFPHSFAQTLRDGGFRPQVFMHHGLMLGLWMCTTALLGLGLWRTRVLPAKPFGLWLGFVVAAHLAVAVLCRSTGAIALLLLGIAAMLEPRLVGSRALLWLLLVAPTAYVALRLSGAVTGESVVDLAALYSSERAESLDYRFFMENIVMELCRERPWFGWSTWGLPQQVQPDGELQKIVIDSYWMSVYMRFGVVGLAGLLALGAAPLWLLLRERPKAMFRGPRSASRALLVLVLGLFMLDCMLNAMFNPIFIVIAGAAVGAAQRRIDV